MCVKLPSAWSRGYLAYSPSRLNTRSCLLSLATNLCRASHEACLFSLFNYNTDIVFVCLWIPSIWHYVEEDTFHAALTASPGAEELELGLTCCTAAENRLKEFIKQNVLPPNM